MYNAQTTTSKYIPSKLLIETESTHNFKISTGSNRPSKLFITTESTHKQKLPPKKMINLQSHKRKLDNTCVQCAPVQVCIIASRHSDETPSTTPSRSHAMSAHLHVATVH